MFPRQFCCAMRVESKSTVSKQFRLLSLIDDITRKPCGSLLQLQKDSKVIDSESVLLSRATLTSRFCQLCIFWFSKSLRFLLTQLDRRPFKKAVDTKTILRLFNRKQCFVVSGQCPHFSDVLSRSLVKNQQIQPYNKPCFISLCEIPIATSQQVYRFRFFSVVIFTTSCHRGSTTPTY